MFCLKKRSQGFSFEAILSHLSVYTITMRSNVVSCKLNDCVYENLLFIPKLKCGITIGALTIFIFYIAVLGSIFKNL